MYRKFPILFVALLAMSGADNTVSIRTAEHYRWGDCCDAWYLVKNDRLNIIQEKMPPGTSETRHLHRKAQQFFYVLAGEAALEIDGHVVVLHAHEGALVSPGSLHRMQNMSKRDLEFVVTSEPPSHGDREEAPLPK
jgi:mannose-6-phosphate isomerase-like protein (cupin superfamily)